MNAARWEHGSEFHWPDSPSQVPVEPPWAGGSTLFGCGRDALRALIEHGRARFGWQRLWMPSYFCQEVVAAAKTGIELATYLDAPGTVPDFGDVRVRRGDAVFIANYFGLRSSIVPPAGAAIVEDHTHDPWSEWSLASVADFCLASLRKTLPVPAGALVWSPRQHELPPLRAVTAERASASSNKIAGMLLKRLYLADSAISKEQFRALLIAGEEEMASGAISGIPALTEALLGVLPVQQWRVRRRRNHEAFMARFQSATPEVLQVLLPAGNEDTTPFSIILIVDQPARRDAIRQRLASRQIYPAVLWPLEHVELDGIPSAHIQLSRRLLSLHCDFRYTSADLERVADVLLATAAESP
jgi:hypothetical protein